MGGDILVRGSVGLARRLQVPDFVVAATVVGFGTSLPELVVSIRAATSGYPNLILGNVVGSNTANVLLVGGASALIFPILPEVGPVRRNVVIMALAIIGFAILAGLNGLGHFGGVALLLAFFAIMAATARSTLQARRKVDPSMPLDWVLGMPSRPVTIAVCILFGILTPVCFCANGIALRYLTHEKIGFNGTTISMSSIFAVNLIILIFAIVYW